jgi:hypothetical protein
MSKDTNTGGGFGRLWSGGRQEKEQPPEPQRPPERAWHGEDNVLPLVRPDRTYIPFDIRDHAERMHIHCATQPSRYPSYHHLLDIIFDHNFQGAFTLVYSFMVVEVTGQNLGEVVHAISYGNCGCIREYHKKLYEPPAPNMSVIESVTILAAAYATDKVPLPTES